MNPEHLRNLCIIAHVDHGKTTLVGYLLRQSGLFAAHERVIERVMDSGDLERERGITILAKNASIKAKGYHFNIVDTPGHADFGGEVERILGTVDGAVLFVDAAEGPLPQTRFVLKKALAQGHRVILCINKVDRPEVVGPGKDRIQTVINAVFDLFVELGADDTQCEFPIVYACARQGWATTVWDDIDGLVSGEKSGTLEPLFDLMISHIPYPRVELQAPFKMQLATLGWSDYVGRLAIGRLTQGSVKKGDTAYRLGDKGVTEKFVVTQVLCFQGLKQTEVDALNAGEIGVVAGCGQIEIGDTLAGAPDVVPFERIAVDMPTLRMQFAINNGPLSGREGTAIQVRELRERLLKECRVNVALKFEDGENDAYFVHGRGELQFSILIETLRREGIEFMVGRPQVLFQKDEHGNELEPMEHAICDVPAMYSGEITDMLQQRKGVLTGYEDIGADRVRLTFDIPARGLLGVRSRFLTATRGMGLLNTEFKGYGPYKGYMVHRKNGTLVSDRTGKATEYALSTLEERGVLVISPGMEVYEGMIIGECNQENDMNVNPVKPKKLTNIRTTSSEGLTMLAGVRKMSLEEHMEWMEHDEWIECTPETVRMRKKVLAAGQRSVIRTKR